MTTTASPTVREQTLAHFKDHVAIRAATTGEFPVETLHWKKPGSSFYALIYMLDQRTGALTVSGDLGAAVYNFHRRATLEDLANCDVGYFASKCTASESGRFFKVWDTRAFEENLDDWIKRHKEELDEVEPTSAAKRLERQTYLEELDSLRDHLLGSSCEAEAYAALSGFTFTGRRPIESETLSDIISGGLVIDPRCEMHLLGLQSALSASPQTSVG